MAWYDFKRPISAQQDVSDERDKAYLERLGKRSVLQRNFGIWSILGFSCTILSTWEGLFATFLIPLQNGGPAGAVYAYIFAWTGTAASFTVLAEMSSIYITGWLTIIGWQTAFASAAYLAGTEIQGAAILAHENYNAQPWHGTLILWAGLLVALAGNLIGGKFLPRLEVFILGIHVIGFFCILIPMTDLADHKTSQEVFRDFLNDGGFPSQGLSWCIGMTGCVFAFAGGDAAVHMAEEVANASTAIPRAILLSVLINGTLGFTMLIAVLFCMGNVQDAVDSKTGYPFMEIFYQATHSIPGSVAMICVLLVIGICSVIGMLAATSRQFWSFARDRGVPGWRVWSRVSPNSSIPIYSVILTMTIACLLGLINIGSSVALNDILSMAVSGLYASYLTVASLLLYRRIKGDISIYDTNDTSPMNVPGARLVWGPFRVPGIWGILLNGYAVIYMIIVVFFSFWPTSMQVEVESMNYSVVGTVGTVILAVVYYFIRARRVYTGPVVEVF
ncbi:hypothetical protein MW887_009482 [Aspergillus wentii]|nr:hypothetical protein MW887_009482 [Aspergillus wentii]